MAIRYQGWETTLPASQWGCPIQTPLNPWMPGHSSAQSVPSFSLPFLGLSLEEVLVSGVRQTQVCVQALVLTIWVIFAKSYNSLEVQLLHS